MGFLRQKYWSGLPCPSPGDFPNPGMEPESPALAGGFFTTEPSGKASDYFRNTQIIQDSLQIYNLVTSPNPFCHLRSHGLRFQGIGWDILVSRHLAYRMEHGHHLRLPRIWKRGEKAWSGQINLSVSFCLYKRRGQGQRSRIPFQV